jgi:hypothetical protein
MFAQHGGSGVTGPAGILSAFISALGGASAAAAAASDGRQTLGRLGDVLGGVADEGLTPTLERLGLDELVGQSALAVVSGLLDHVAGAGETVEGAAAREAASEVLEALFSSAEAYEDATSVPLDVNQVLSLLQQFLAAYVWKRVLQNIADRLVNNSPPGQVRAREREIRRYIDAKVALTLQEIDPLSVDWSGDEAEELIGQLMTHVLQVFELE